MRDESLVELPEQPAGTAWPTERWPEHTPGAESDVDHARLGRLSNELFTEPYPEGVGLTRAFLVVHRGAIVHERYGPGFHTELHELAGQEREPDGPDTTLISWSMAKSMLHALVGIAVRDGLLDVTNRVPVPEWADSSDPRHRITWDHLLRMSSGLEWVEEYVEGRGSDVIEMLFGRGSHDMAAFAAAKPLRDPINHVFAYSSGTTNILAGCLQRVLGVEHDAMAMRRYLEQELFAPIGMKTASPGFDEVGTFVASSYVYATARDFARFGLLYLRDGVWDGRRLLPEDWVDYGRTTTETAPRRDYGAHWWISRDDWGTFAAHGYEGQRICCVPGLDLVIVRLGKSPLHEDDTVENPLDVYLDQVIDCFTGL